MAALQSVLEFLTGKEIVDALIGIMAEKFEGFVQTQRRCSEALGILREELGEDSVKEEMEAIERQTASNLFYSGFLGMKANFDNFMNPAAKNFLDADWETFLRENTAKRLPEYEAAQKERDQFFARLSPGQREVHEDVTGYVSYLETVGPKLAHYYGYILGNRLLYRVVPGYHPDMAQTLRYRMMLEGYFGKRFDWDGSV